MGLSIVTALVLIFVWDHHHQPAILNADSTTESSAERRRVPGVDEERTNQESKSERLNLRDIQEADIDVVGRWEGFKALFHCSSLIVRKDSTRPDRHRLLFVEETDLGTWHAKRTAKLANGVLTLDRPIDQVGLRPTNHPYRVLYPVRTSRGEFLLPSVNAEDIASVDEIRPGLAYERSRSAPAETARERKSIATPLDDATEQIESLLLRTVQTAIQRMPLLASASFGSACWLAHTGWPSKALAIIFEPQIQSVLAGNGRDLKLLRDYARSLYDGFWMLACDLIPDENLPID